MTYDVCQMVWGEYSIKTPALPLPQIRTKRMGPSGSFPNKDSVFIWNSKLLELLSAQKLLDLVNLPAPPISTKNFKTFESKIVFHNIGGWGWGP